MHGRLRQYPRAVQFVAVAALFALAAAVYLPGIHGPWLFDDYSNLLYNSFIRVRDLDFSTLFRASYSLNAGPLQRPVAMLSFAVNYYFAGSFDSTLSFKLTNLVIHAINGILVFWCVRLILQRQADVTHSVDQAWKLGIGKNTWMALAVALLWTVHPIQVSSVLYVVQRMAELATLFMLLSLICYLVLRTQQARGHGSRFSTAMLIAACVAFWLLGMLSKENAAILPVIALLLEYTLFSRQLPWLYWDRLKPPHRIAILYSCAALGLAAAYFAFQYALPGYAGRPFTFTERVLTEARVLFFYLYLILIPQIDQFTLYHDDVALSASLISPWTTLPAVLGHVGLILFAVVSLFRRKRTMLALGIMWFYIGHVLESSIFPLELMHEHRNYFPSLGVFIALVELIRLGARRLGLPKLAWCLPVFFLFFSAVTTTRAYQWSSYNKFYAFELIHHPHSAMANSGLAGMLTKMGRLQDAENALRLAAELQPDEPSHLIWLLSAEVQGGKPPETQVQQQILQLLDNSQLTATTVRTLGDVAGCLGTWCKALSRPMEQWLDVLLRPEHHAGDKSYYYYLLGISLVNQGKTAESITAFWKSYEMDPEYLHPLFSLISIYIQLNDLNSAENTLRLLKKSDQNNPHSMPRRVALVAAEVERLRNSLSVSPHEKN